MSFYDYRLGQRIATEYDDFYAILQALMRLAGGENLEKLKATWPEVWEELQTRYHAPGGLLSGETILI